MSGQPPKSAERTAHASTDALTRVPGDPRRSLRLQRKPIFSDSGWLFGMACAIPPRRNSHFQQGDELHQAILLPNSGARDFVVRRGASIHRVNLPVLLAKMGSTTQRFVTSLPCKQRPRRGGSQTNEKNLTRKRAQRRIDRSGRNRGSGTAFQKYSAVRWPHPLSPGIRTPRS